MSEPMGKLFRFGVLGSDGSVPVERWHELARRIEGDGFSTLLVGDHFLTELSCTARLASAAAVTDTLRLGSYVYSNDFRHPALLAKEPAELDVLSGGRFELGIGAGWLNDEYEVVGITFDAGPVRVSRFQESVQLVRRLLAGETVTHHGAHYDIEGYQLPTAPLQRPVPLLLGGGGSRMTRFAGRHADIVGFNPKALPEGGLDPDEFGEAAFEERLRLLDEVVGRTTAGPERGILLFHVARRLDDLPSDGWADLDVLENSPYTLIGRPQDMVETLMARRDRWGLSYYVCFEEDAEILAPVVYELAGR
ncbi:MAG TPA: TIGR03621 family F420-dependent LLM class oxidoreductase [Nocardioidaceae bacterium]|nr:TIGR03621 family F420-dependent LLM class oxidoreductase [Nocardioidaceae bacterium]